MSNPELKKKRACIFTVKYEAVGAKLSYGRGHRAFKIWFNGKFVLISKRFAPIDAKLRELIDK